MKLIDKNALVAEIEKCYNECLKRAKITDPHYWYAKADAYRNVLVVLNDTLEVKEVQEEPVSEDLEEAAENYAVTDEVFPNGKVMIDFQAEKAFRAGAKWQKEQLLAKAFDFTQEHNIACTLASECLRNHGWFSRERDFNDLFRHLSCVDKLFEGKFGGKTKVIAIKED